MKEIDNFYNTYNARHLKPAEVAESFIFSNNFEKLIQNDHSVILGARGCGKTTLMKMLTLPALHNWNNERAADIRTNLPFYAVYISTDIYWDVKNQTYSSELESFGSFSEKISQFSVTSNVFSSLCDTFKNILEIDLVCNDEAKEVELCRTLIKAWRLDLTVPKIEYVKEALNERVDFVNQFIQDVIFNYKKNEDVNTPEFFNLSFETSLEYVIPVFERIYGLQGKKQWALCFDELEFAPLWLQEKLFKSLRSRTQYILYKLSASPILPSTIAKSLTGDYSATIGNDVSLVKMWGTSEADAFSRKIIESCLLRRLNIHDAKAYFGSNEIYNKNPDSYKEGSAFYKEMLELLKKDDAFKSFLLDKNIDVSRPIPVDNQKDVLFRKIKPIVAFRNYYLSENRKEGNKVKWNYRSRKTGELYSGIEVLTKICDGNPRWLIAIVTSILSKSATRGMSEKLQYDEIISAAKRFQNVIANIPTGPNISTPLTDIIERVGQFFKYQVLGPVFNLDPKGTFIVDENLREISGEVVGLLEKGIAQGALILVDSDGQSFDFEVRGKRLKLSYLFFPLYEIPLRKYTDIKLSECLRGLQIESQGQTSLF
jgi:energy-coupling factor transporter ATP-binding protein EcfA2